MNIDRKGEGAGLEGNIARILSDNKLKYGKGQKTWKNVITSTLMVDETFVRMSFSNTRNKQ